MIKQIVGPRRTTYCGTPAEVTEYRTAKSGTCERVVACKWLADNPEQPIVGGTKEVFVGQIDLHHCKGDGRKPSFQSFSVKTVRTDEALTAFLELTIDA